MAVLPAILVAAPAPLRAAPRGALFVEAHADPESGLVTGRFRYDFVNTSDAVLRELRLFEYPDHYAADPKLDDVLRERVYPSAWEPGSQDVWDLAVRDGADVADALPTPVAWESMLAEGVPILRVALPSPLSPGGALTLEGRFETRIPRMFGTFGHYRGVVTLNGGLAPMPVDVAADGAPLLHALPPRLPLQVELDVPAGWTAVLGGLVAVGDPPLLDAALGQDGGFVAPAAVPGSSLAVSEDEDEPDGRRTLRFEAASARWPSVSLHRRAVHQELPLAGGQSVSFVGRPLRRAQARWVRRAVQTARETLRERGGSVPERGVVLVEAPLRRNLVELGDGVIFVSDRFLEVDLPLFRYHDLHLARAVMADALRDLVDAREEPDLLPLTLEGVSWELVPEYLRIRWKNHVNLRSLLERFAFLPAVDTLLETPVFPFADQIFDNPWVLDPLKADVRRFNRPLRSGRVLFLKLEDRVGAESLRQAVKAYVGNGNGNGEGDGDDFYGLLERRAGVAVRETARSWLGAIVRENLRIESVRRGRDKDGSYRTSVTVRREVLEGSIPDETVEITLRPPPPRRGRITLQWEGSEESHTWELRTLQPLGSVTVDPRGRVQEIDREGLSVERDNRRPRGLSVTGGVYPDAFAVTAGGYGIYAEINLRERFDRLNVVSLRAFSDDEVLLGIGPAYEHYFGPRRYGSYRQHRVRVGAYFHVVNPFFLPDDPPLAAELRGGWVWDDRAFAYSPSRGGRISVTGFFGRDFALLHDARRPLSEAGWIGIEAVGVRLLPLHPWHTLALRGKLGVIAGNVENRQFTLGGDDDVRGYPETWAVGNLRGVVSAEWRHWFVRDRDIRWVLSRYRGLQGSLFIDAGIVTDDPSRPIGRENVGFSIGYGIRTYADFLGVLPGMGGVEIAWAPGGPSGRWPIWGPYERWPVVPFQVYLVGSQSF